MGRVRAERDLAGSWSRRSAIPGTRFRRSGWRGRWRARARGGGRDVGALARGGRGARGWSSRRPRSTRRFPRPRRTPTRGRRRPTRRWRCCRYVEQGRFDVVVSDILTLAPALAAERAGVRRATLIPHVYPVHEPGLPFFSFGAFPARTPVGRALWRAALPVLVGGLERGRDEMNQSRARGRAAGRSSGFTAGSARSWRWWRRFRSSSTRAAGRRRCT